jgi:hypothetical protein
MKSPVYVYVPVCNIFHLAPCESDPTKQASPRASRRGEAIPGACVAGVLTLPRLPVCVLPAGLILQAFDPLGLPLFGVLLKRLTLPMGYAFQPGIYN